MMLPPRRSFICLAVLGLTCAPMAVSAGGSAILAVGIFGHDQGPSSDHHESGVNLNLEVQFAPRDFYGSPRPHIGITPNFNGDTSMAYAGLTFLLYQRSRWFLDGFISTAVHDGPLHKDPVGCAERSDCGFGVRAMPRFGVEIGYRLDERSAVTLFVDHMSHKWVIPGENEGIEHTGLRYLRSF